MDTILYGGRISTLAGPDVCALAIQNGRIAFAGSDEAALALRREETRLIDLAGRRVLPGFCDSHTHMLLTGAERARLDLRGVNSSEEIIRRGRAYLERAALPEGAWIVGYGFDHNRFDPPLLPDRSVADAISTAHPVLLDRVCGHVGAANGLALARAGFDETTSIPGGTLDLDEKGALKGILREKALDTIKTFLPKMDLAQVTRHLEETGRLFASLGLTSVQSDDLGPEGSDWDTLRKAMDILRERGALRIRIFEEWEAPTPAALAEITARGFSSGTGDECLQLCNIKLITDGSLGTRTAFLREDYSDEPGNRGIPVYTQEALNELTLLCHEADLQVAFHAIGDGAIAQCLRAVERAMAQNPKPLRHRIVHCQIGDAALYARMASLGMGADIQPAFVPSDCALTASRLGARAQSSYAWKTLLDAGVALGGGSDSPVEDPSPLWGICCAVTRPDGSGAGPWQPEECLTVEEAVCIYTKGSAALSGSERELGTLEAGKLADLVVLEEDIFTVPPARIKDIAVHLTMMGGELTYRRED